MVNLKIVMEPLRDSLETPSTNKSDKFKKLSALAQILSFLQKFV